MRIIAPSILSADFTKLGDEIKSVEDAGADWIHVDVMDGHFVPAITMGPIITKAARSITSLPLDVHLMIENPDLYITDFVKAGATLISVHVEACVHLNRTIQMIKDLGIKAGVAINPSTPLSSLDWILEFVDFVLIMSVNPGFGGQVFIPNSIDKIMALRKMIKERELSTLIEIDGGVTEKNIEEISIASADAYLAGSPVVWPQEYTKTNSILK